MTSYLVVTWSLPDKGEAVSGRTPCLEMSITTPPAGITELALEVELCNSPSVLKAYRLEEVK